MTLDLWQTLQTAFAHAGGTVEHMDYYPKLHWDAVSAAINGTATDGFYKLEPFTPSSGSFDWGDVINLALAAAAADGRGGVRIPPGIIDIETPILMPDRRVSLVGYGPQVSVLRMADGANLDNMVIMGAASTAITTQQERISLRDITIDGNKTGQSSGTGALVQAINCVALRLLRLQIRQAFDVGLLIDTHASTVGSSLMQYSMLDDVEIETCSGTVTGYAAIFRGGKNNKHRGLFVRSSGRAGLLVQGAGFLANNETNQCTGTDWHITDNGTETPADGIGVTFDNATRWVCTDAHVNFNPAGGVLLKRSDTASGHGDNGITLTNWDFRNNGLDASATFSCIRTESAGDAKGLVLVAPIMQSITGIADQPMVYIEGGAETQIHGGIIRLGPSTGVHLVDCTDTTIHGVRIRGCGSETPDAVAPAGLHIDGGNGIVTNVHLENNGSTTANGGHELRVEGTLVGSGWRFSDMTIHATEDGRETSVTSTAAGVDISGTKLADAVTPQTVASAASITIPWGADFIQITGTTDVATVLPVHRAGTRKTLQFTNAAPGDLKHGTGNVILATGADFSPTQNQLIEIVSDGTNWRS